MVKDRFTKRIVFKSGFLLLEAILTVVIVSICLTFLAQSLFANFRTGVRFQETVRSLLAMENKLGLLFATDASDDQVNTYPQPLDAPYDKFKVTAWTQDMDVHLKKIGLKLNWPTGRTQGQLDLTTSVYIPDAT